MRHDSLPSTDSSFMHGDELRIGSLFSGYGGLDLAVEFAFNGRTVWQSEIHEPVARVLAHRWPHAPNLGDITQVNWNEVKPVDVLCGGFPCQDVSTVGKMAGLAPGTRSGLWSYMAEAVDQLRPKYVVIENVRGLLSATATRATPEGEPDATPHHATSRNLGPATWGVGDEPTRPLRALGAVLGDLADIGYDATWFGVPASIIGAPHPRNRVFILARPAASHAARDGRVEGRREPRPGEKAKGNDRAVSPGDRSGAARTVWLSDMAKRAGDPVVIGRGDIHRWGKYADAIRRWEFITGRLAPEPALLTDVAGPRAAPRFVEWLMGLPDGWVTNAGLGLTTNQQLAALGNGVLPLQAATALRVLLPNSLAGMS